MFVLLGLAGGILLLGLYYFFQAGKNQSSEKSSEVPVSALEAKIESLKKQESNKPLWSILHHAEVNQLADFLKQQPPNAVALILCAIESNRAAAILEAMPIDQQVAVITHISTTKPVLAAQLKARLEKASL
jgi:flagellar motor switch protein FliG